jgi:hypothetical protein
MENRVDLGGDSGGLGLKETQSCGLLDGYVGTFVVLNFKRKSCVSCAPCDLLFVACSCLPLSSVLELGLLMIYYSS